MKTFKPSFVIAILFMLSLLSGAVPAAYAQPAMRIPGSSRIEERNVRAHMEFLAGDALQGRGSGTQFELIAAKYLASMLQQFGIEPAGEIGASGGKTYIQTVNVTRNTFAENPKLTYGSTVLEFGKDMVVYQLASEKISGKLQKLKPGDSPKSGEIIFIRAGDENSFPNLDSIAENAPAIIVEENPQRRSFWDRLAARKVSFTTLGGDRSKPAPATIIVSKDSADALSKAADGTQIEIAGKLGEPQTSRTWNAVGKITGNDSKLASEVILLSAHLDHLGVRENAPTADKIFNGADDDASGCVAVLELARELAKDQRPKRTIYFVFYGSEEAGGFGSRYFVENLAFPKEKLIANLQFEMLGRADPKVGIDELWLTGFDRSDLGAELARRGAKLVNDPHPDQNFFQRSDNYTLARQGIIAHTVSSFNLHKDYHQASDEIETIDFGHLTRSINAMLNPIEWLVNSDFKPVWYEGKKP